MGEESSCENIKNRNKGWRRFTGILCALLNSLVFTSVLGFIKLLNGRYTEVELALYRNLGGLIGGIILVTYYSKWKNENFIQLFWPIKGNKKFMSLLIMVGLLSASNVIFRFWSLHYLSIEDSTICVYSKIFFIIVIAHFFLKEKIKITSMLVGIFIMIGVFMITRPKFLTDSSKSYDVNNLIGVGIVLLSVICASFNVVILRTLRKTHYSLLILIYGITGTFLSGSLAISLGRVSPLPSTAFDISMLFFISLNSLISQFFLILSFKFEDAGIVSIFRTSEVLWSFLFSYLFLKSENGPDIFSFLGAGILFIGIGVTALQKYIYSELESLILSNLRSFIPSILYISIIVFHNNVSFHSLKVIQCSKIRANICTTNSIKIII